MGHKLIIDNFKEEKQKIRVGARKQERRKNNSKKNIYIYIYINFFKKKNLSYIRNIKFQI